MEKIPLLILIGVFTVFGALAVTDATPEHEDFVLTGMYATSNNGEILYRLEPVPNDDPIWVLVTDVDEYNRMMRGRTG